MRGWVVGVVFFFAGGSSGFGGCFGGFRIREDESSGSGIRFVGSGALRLEAQSLGILGLVF